MSSSSVIIRRLHCADVLQLRKLNALFAGAFGEQETYGGEPSDAYLQGLLAKEHVIAIVAMTGDEVIGGLVAYELDKFERIGVNSTSMTWPWVQSIAAGASRPIRQLHEIAVQRRANS
jgi:hypothetical protein